MLDWVSQKTVSEVQLLLCCVFFGFTYVGQKQADMEGMSVFNFTAGRFVVSTIFLYTLRPALQDVIESDISDENKEELDKLSMNKFIEKFRQILPFNVSEKKFHLYFWAINYGVLCFISSELLQLGMVGATAGKAAFIIGLNVVVIQMIEMALPDYNTSLTWVICLAISLSVMGMYFLSGCFDLYLSGSGESCSDVVTHYDFLVFLSMIGFGGCILLADAGSSRTDCIDLMCLSFLVATVLAVATALVYDAETWLSLPTLSSLFSFKTVIVIYTGISEVSAVTLGTLGQMYVSPTRSALIMSLEATSSAVLAFFILGEKLSASEMVGCGLMFLATLISTTVTVGGPDEEDEERGITYGSMSGDNRADTGYSIDFDKRIHQLERFMKTNQRSLHRVIALRRARSRHPMNVARVIDESTSLLEIATEAAAAGGSPRSAREARKKDYETM